MNKFTSVLLSACILSSSASWSMCQAVGNFVKNNHEMLGRAIFSIGTPLALGYWDCTRVSEELADTKKLAVKIANEDYNHKKVAEDCLCELEKKEKGSKYLDIAKSCIVGQTAAIVYYTLSGVRDPIDIAAVGVGTAVTSLMQSNDQLSNAAFRCNLVLKSISKEQ